VEQVARAEEALRMAAPYFATAGASDYEANRELVRSVAAYLAAIELSSRETELMPILSRAYAALAALAWYQPQVPDAPRKPATDPRPAGPPFPLTAPATDGVSDAEKKEAGELRDRYEAAAGQASVAWPMADGMRASLAAQGMSLNSITETSLARIQLYLEFAADGLREKQWSDARVNLERAEYETAKVLRTFGR
jgi:hypothetical protein